MTKAQFKNQMEVYGNNFYGDTCYKLKLEIIKKIVNCRAIPDFEKLALVDSYTKSSVTNNFVVETIHQFNKR